MSSSRSPADVIADFLGRSPATVRLGLSRMEAAVEQLGHPERRFRVLHVAGTNGKGSTCAFAMAILRAHGLRVGLYTSPHLISVNERFVVDGQPIDDDALAAQLKEVRRSIGEGADTLTFYELGTLVAFSYFAAQKVDVGVIEVGLGGRLDATNVVRPHACAIASIGFDHTEYLGTSLGEIAGEKAGILKAGVPAVVSPQPEEARRAIAAKAEAVGAKVRFADAGDFRMTRVGRAWRYESPSLTIPDIQLALAGPHQGDNAALAIAAVEHLVPLEPARVRRGCANAVWPGRMELFLGSPPWLLDGAHNGAGVAVLCRALREAYPSRRPQLVFAVLGDKDIQAMCEQLFPVCAAVHLPRLNYHREAAPEVTLHNAQRLGVPAFQYASVEAALKAATAATGPDGLVLCAGSLVLVGQARAVALARQAGRR
ncbi:MAG: bifunctional folylpolyglutamate synthase/dihydrofolate synthase [Myxococcaceae bacterium]